MINKQTSLFLNGPILSFTQSPVSVTVDHSGIATFSGIATATFPTQTPTNPAVSDGQITYRWYASGVTDPLSDGAFRGATLSGTATTTLTVTGATSPTTNQSSFFLRADYTPSAYSQPTGSPVTAGTARSTGRDIARGLNSNVGILTVRPFITITTQPQNATAATGSQVSFSVDATLSDNTFGELTYQWQLNEVDLVDATSPSLVQGSRTRNLILNSPTTTGTYNVRVIVRNTNTQQVTSNTATLTVVSPRSIVVFEGYNSQNDYQKVEQNLDNSANFTLSDSTFTHSPNVITFYASEKDIDTEFLINSSKGSDNGTFVGGNGGSSRIRLTLQKDVEHTVLGIANNSSVFLYRGSSLIAVVGEGGDAGTGGNGGAGGGVNDAGQNGGGTNAGTGGTRQSITSSGIFGSASSVQSTNILAGDTKANPPDGGRTITCSKGNYWIQQGIAECNTNGIVQFRNTDGTLITQSALITRGFKPGYTINATEGAAIGNNAGNGGGGATGGAGGRDNAGGGGGSGYISNVITALSSTIGGNSSVKSTINLKVYATPTYAISPSSTTINEGSSVTFTVTTTNVSDGTILYWTTNGTVNASDFSDTVVSGSFPPINNNTTSITRSLVNDSTTEGNESFAIEIRTESTSGTVVATSSAVIVNDSSQSGGGGGGGGGGAPVIFTDVYYVLGSPQAIPPLPSQNVTFTVTQQSQAFNGIEIDSIRYFPENSQPATISVSPGRYYCILKDSTKYVRPAPDGKSVQGSDGGGTWDDIIVYANVGSFTNKKAEYYIYRYGNQSLPNAFGISAGTCPTTQTRRGAWYKSKNVPDYYLSRGLPSTTPIHYPVYTQTLGPISYVQFYFIKYLNRPCEFQKNTINTGTTTITTGIEYWVGRYNAVGAAGLEKEILNSPERKYILKTTISPTSTTTNPADYRYNTVFPLSECGDSFTNLPVFSVCSDLSLQYNPTGPSYH